MEFKPSNAGDIERYYRSTYVKFAECGDKLFRIEKVTKEAVYGVDEDEREFVLYLHEDAPYTVDFTLPHKSYFQLDKTAMQLVRKPARQYQRGISESNTYLQLLNSEGGVSPKSPTFKSLKAYVNKQLFPSFQEAMTNKAKHNSTCLSPRIAIAHMEKRIFIDNVCVATALPKEKQIVVHSAIFTPEIEEIIQGSVFKVLK